MKVGILGSGAVAKSLAAGFLQHDHAVMLGTRTRDKLNEWAAQNPRATVGSVADAASFANGQVALTKPIRAPPVTLISPIHGFLATHY